MQRVKPCKSIDKVLGLFEGRFNTFSDIEMFRRSKLLAVVTSEPDLFVDVTDRFLELEFAVDAVYGNEKIQRRLKDNHVKRYRKRAAISN